MTYLEEIIPSKKPDETANWSVIYEIIQKASSKIRYGNLDLYEREEIAQMTAISILRNNNSFSIDKVNIPGKEKIMFDKFIMRCVRNEIRNYRKRNKSKKEYVKTHSGIVEQSIDVESLPNPIPTMSEIITIVKNANIPRKGQAALYITYLDNRGPREASDIIGMNESTYQNRLSRARYKLRNDLSQLVELSAKIAQEPAINRDYVYARGGKSITYAIEKNY